MIWAAVLWSYVTDAWLVLRRRWQTRRLRRALRQVDWRAFQERWKDVEGPSVMGGGAARETAQEWFNRTEGKTK